MRSCLLLLVCSGKFLRGARDRVLRRDALRQVHGKRHVQHVCIELRLVREHGHMRSGEHVQLVLGLHECRQQPVHVGHAQLRLGALARRLGRHVRERLQ